MDPLDIQYALKRKGITQVSLAKEFHVSEMTVSKVIRRALVSDRIMRGIAAKVGKKHTVVFPEYYRQPPKRITSKVASKKAA